MRPSHDFFLRDLLPRVQRKPVKKKEKTPLKLETDIHSFETTNIRETPQKDLKVNECLSYHDEIKFLVNEVKIVHRIGFNSALSNK